MNALPSFFGRPREWAIDLAVASAIGVFLGVIGPFGSYYGGSLGQRIAFWVANMWIGFMVLSLVSRLAIRLAIRWDVPIWFALALGVAVGSAPLSALIAPFAALVWPGNHGRVTNLYVVYSQNRAPSPTTSSQIGAGGPRWPARASCRRRRPRRLRRPRGLRTP